MKKRSGALSLAFIGLLLVSSGCLPDTTPTPLPTSLPPTQAVVVNLQPTTTPQPAQTALPASTLQEAILEQFDGDLHNWSYFSGKHDPDADDSQARPVVKDGFLVFDIARNLDVYAVYEPSSFENVRVDVSVQNTGTGDHTINLLCRLTDRGWYEVSIKNNGFFWIFACDFGRGACITLADGASSRVNPGKASNEYSLVCQDRLLKVITNGFEAGSFVDNRFVYPSGKIGVGLSSYEDNSNKVEFDWVRIGQP